MGSLLERFLGQLDALIPFLALTHSEVFDVLRARYGDWLPEWQQESLPQTFAAYQTQVTHAAFLLGYSYYEAFLSDLLRNIYKHRPEMLPKDKQVTVGDILERGHYDVLLDFMIDREVFTAVHGSKEDLIKYFNKKMSLNWPLNTVDSAIEASLLRNSIIHNNAR